MLPEDTKNGNQVKDCFSVCKNEIAFSVHVWKSSYAIDIWQLTF